MCAYITELATTSEQALILLASQTARQPEAESAVRPAQHDPRRAEAARRSQSSPSESTGTATRCLLGTTTRSAGGDSCFLANEQSWRNSWRAPSPLSRTTRSSRLATGARSRRTVAERATRQRTWRCSVCLIATATPRELHRSRAHVVLMHPCNGSGRLRLPLVVQFDRDADRRLENAATCQRWAGAGESLGACTGGGG
jgi:hypothetical protein